MSVKLRIQDLPLDERPREKLIRFGPESLATRELLALILGTGTRQYSALTLADKLLSKFGSLRQLSEASLEELASVQGVGLAKASKIMASFALSKRLSQTSLNRRPISGPSDAADLIMEDMRYLQKEYFKAIMLDSKNSVIEVATISVGHLNASLVHPRELFKECIKRSTCSVIILHNHPSGDPTPSQEDLEITKRIVQAGHLLGINVLDHIIIGDNRYVSLKERGLL